MALGFPARSVLGAVLALASLKLAACETAHEVGGDLAYALNPFGSTQLRVHAVEPLGPYLVAAISGRRERIRMIAPADAACGAVLRPEAILRYTKSGTFGRVASGGASCDLVGVASLGEWRDRQPRRRGGALVPRASARFETLYADASGIWVRGRFALASRVGIPAGYDLVALLPNDTTCRALAERGEASLEFRPAGPEPFRLLRDDRVCGIQGFATPLGAP